MKKLIVWNKDGTINWYNTKKNTAEREERLKPRTLKERNTDSKELKE